MSFSLSSTRSFDNSFSAFERSAYLVKHSYGVGVEVKTHVKYYLLEVDFHEAYTLAHGKVRDFSFEKHFVALWLGRDNLPVRRIASTLRLC